MSLSSRQLDAFVATARKRSFTKAADALCITQSALSQRIQQLEAQLGLLFIRSPKRLALTPLAESLLNYCQQKISLEDAFLSQVTNKQQVQGLLRMAAFSTAYRSFILKRLVKLTQQFPDIQLTLIEHELRDLSEALFSGTVDYIISTQPLYKNQVKTIYLGQEVNTLVQKINYYPPPHPIYLDHDNQDETTLFYLSQQYHPPTIYQRHFLDNIHLIIEGVKLGLGQAVLPLDILDSEPDIEEVPGLKAISFPLYLMYYEQLHQTPLQEAFINYLSTEKE